METTCSHLLLVDHDLDMCGQLSDYLGQNDFHVTTVNTAKRMLDFIACEAVDLPLLEPRLRGEDGLRPTRTVRETSMPIVVVSRRDEVADRVMGLELGADDYITKPFSLCALLARIRAVLRRCKVDVVGPVRDELRGNLSRRVWPAPRLIGVSPTDLEPRAITAAYAHGQYGGLYARRTARF